MTTEPELTDEQMKFARNFMGYEEFLPGEYATEEHKNGWHSASGEWLCNSEFWGGNCGLQKHFAKAETREAVWRKARREYNILTAPMGKLMYVEIIVRDEKGNGTSERYLSSREDEFTALINALMEAKGMMDFKCPRCGDERIGHRCEEILGVQEPDSFKELMDAAEETGLTDEQWGKENEALMDKIKQQSAEAVAKWLGVAHNDGYFHINDKSLKVDYIGADLALIYVKTKDDLTRWLSSDAGTVAMIEKLRYGSGVEAYALQIVIFSCESNNLNAALKAACLEVLNV